MNITGYKQVDYNTLQDRMADKKGIKSNMHLALEVGVDSPQTIKNAFQKDTQMVSDKILTTLFDTIGISAVVVWENGTRNYYIKGK